MKELDCQTTAGAAAVRGRARRDFLRLVAAAAVPASGLWVGCAAQVDGAPESVATEPELALERAQLLGACPDDAERERRTRWTQLHAHYVGAENARDLPKILTLFAAEATLTINGRRFDDPRSIADAHTLLGMSNASAGLAGTQVIHDREFFTDEELLVYGRVRGNHIGQVLHFPPTFRQVELHYSAFYRFDEAGKIVAERIVMNWGPLAGA